MASVGEPPCPRPRYSTTKAKSWRSTSQSDSGSKVVGALPPIGVFVDPDSIPWLRLDAKTAEGPGIFAGTTFIQRVNTAGGKAPLANGIVVGQVARVPYIADYFFYREANE